MHRKLALKARLVRALLVAPAVGVLLIVSATLAGPAQATAGSPALVDRVFTFFLDTNTCTGEHVSGEGTVHSVSKLQSDNTWLTRINIHAEGAGTSGNEYVLNWIQTQSNSTAGASGTAHDMLISKGSAPNQLLTATYNTVTGEFTFEPLCRG